MSESGFTEVTELAGQQPLFRELVRSAFAARLGEVSVTYDFHRSWNGGWRCRAQIPGKAPLEFALLQAPNEALLAFPVPFPTGWRVRGVLDSTGVAWTTDMDGLPVRVGAGSGSGSGSGSKGTDFRG